jgi:hypothetical protein
MGWKAGHVALETIYLAICIRSPQRNRRVIHAPFLKKRAQELEGDGQSALESVRLSA